MATTMAPVSRTRKSCIRVKTVLSTIRDTSRSWALIHPRTTTPSSGTHHTTHILSHAHAHATTAHSSSSSSTAPVIPMGPIPSRIPPTPAPIPMLPPILAAVAIGFIAPTPPAPPIPPIPPIPNRPMPMPIPIMGLKPPIIPMPPPIILL
ncbi:hypothetical protein BGY98DRAFT_577131 [Russula aff. rugulosa BPL654]|nr:hypothetical protein BGY98DRAFT_577131 [Russula aff. rugulosa BPL654]